MILSASRRTDIPCYYAKWMMNRLKEGYVLTRNPMNHAQLSRICLSPQLVDCIVFWTKDPYPLLPYLGELDQMGYQYYFQFTLTPYDRTIEGRLRPKEEILETFRCLSGRIGRQRVIWRYDPIILNQQLTVSYHKEQFHRMCEVLSPFTDTVTISFVTLYPKLKTPLIRDVSPQEKVELARELGCVAAEYRLNITACCQQEDFSPYGILPSSCIDAKRIEKICGVPLDLKKDKNQRKGCGCAESIDIGAYNTCLNACVYCYANDSFPTTLRRYQSHDPYSPLLMGKVMDNETILPRKTHSNKQQQMEWNDLAQKA